MNENVRTKTTTVAGLGLLTAVVIVLQLLASNIRFGVFSITLTLVPIIVGAALYGRAAGAWLGFVFSVIVLIMDSAAFMTVNAPGTVITVLVKGTCAGLLAGVVYLAVEKHAKKSLPAVILAGITAPVVNTGLFVIGCFLFFYPTISGWAADAGFSNGAAYIIFGLVGVNFIVELLINMILSAVVVQIVRIGRRGTA